jgi:hypothetical protein
MELALLLNPTDTQTRTTGNKPTVFVNYSGHCTLFDVRIYLNGWKSDRRSDIYYSVWIGHGYEPKELDECISKLETLYTKWKDKAPENV